MSEESIINTSISTLYSSNNSDNLDNVLVTSSNINSIFNFIFTNEQEKTKYTGEYLEEIFYNLLEEEKEIKKPIYGYMSNQKDINEKMRAILIDWLIDIHYNFNLKKETLFQTIWLIDTYISYEQIPRSKFQLLGIACLLISCKYNEVYYPRIIEFINITAKAYEIKELLKMEQDILKRLDFNILAPTAIQFYDILSKLFNFNSKQYHLGNYFLESYLIDYNMTFFPSSIIALSCAYIVMKFFNLNNYKYLYSIIDENNKYIFQQNIIKKSARQLCFVVKNLSQSSLKAVKNKYSLEKFDKVSQYCEE